MGPRELRDVSGTSCHLGHHQQWGSIHLLALGSASPLLLTPSLLLRPPSCLSVPHLHPEMGPVKLVSLPCPTAHRSKFQASTPFSPYNSATSSGPPNLN